MENVIATLDSTTFLIISPAPPQTQQQPRSHKENNMKDYEIVWTINGPFFPAGQAIRPHGVLRVD